MITVTHFHNYIWLRNDLHQIAHPFFYEAKVKNHSWIVGYLYSALAPSLFLVWDQKINTEARHWNHVKVYQLWYYHFFWGGVVLVSISQFLGYLSFAGIGCIGWVWAGSLTAAFMVNLIFLWSWEGLWFFVIPRTWSDVYQFVGANFLVLHSAEIWHKKLSWIVNSISHTPISQCSRRTSISKWLGNLTKHQFVGGRVAEVVRGHVGPPQKSLDLDENFKPEHTPFCR